MNKVANTLRDGTFRWTQATDIEPLSVRQMEPEIATNRNRDLEDLAIQLSDEDKTVRTSFGQGAEAFVRGWPSKGGVYILESCDGVELDFLQLDRFEPASRSQNQTEEDAHCSRMRKLGAVWWESDEHYIVSKIVYKPRKGEEPVLYLGWPADGGVWILKNTADGAADMGAGRVKLARDMEERCRLIERLGGKFYKNPQECPDLDLD